MARRALSDLTVRRLKPGAKRRIVPDGGMIGHYLRLMPSGAKSFVAVARDPYQKQQWVTIGSPDHLSVEESRTRAREIIKRIRSGLPPVEPAPPAPDSFRDVAENWFKRHVEAKGLRTRGEIRRSLTKYVYPTWAGRDFASIRKSDIARLLDHIEDQHGSAMADRVLGFVASVMHFQAARLDDYSVPVSRGMRRTSTKERARTRILSDDELRAVWRQAEASGVFGAVIMTLLLTGQRLAKVVQMRWDDVAGGVWSIRTEDREKGTGQRLILPEAAMEVIGQQPRFEGCAYVFAGRGGVPLNSFGKAKRRFDAGLPPMPGWVLHDLRRCWRSLAARAGVPDRHAEVTIGHTITGVEGVYLRHSFETEKADALRRVAALIGEIISPSPTDKVVRLKRR
jgi:integrase